VDQRRQAIDSTSSSQVKSQKIAKKDRPVVPERNALYPTKAQIALRLLQEFRDNHKGIKIKAVLADALYGNSD
jgi:SRSO17 transposase